VSEDRLFRHARLASFYAVACLVLAGAMLTACSSLNTRKQERSAAYESLPPSTRQLVDQGKISPGMDTNAVYIVLGPPSAVVGAPATQPQTVWVYYGSRPVLVPCWTFLPTSRGYWSLEYTPAHYAAEYTKAEVVFENGRVVACRQQ